jgi:ligand-binding sensor domain-containing protein
VCIYDVKESSDTNEYASSDLTDVSHVVDGIQRKLASNSEVELQLGDAMRRVGKAVRKFQVSRIKPLHRKSALILAFRRSNQHSSS